jgi:hypothetical protein
MKKPELHFPTILGVLVAIGGLAAGLWLVQKQMGQSVAASAEEQPREIRITNISDSGFVVSWLTNKAVSGYLQYGEGKNDNDMVVSDERDQEKGAIELYFTHYVVIKGLKPSTSYRFKIGSGKSTLGGPDGQPYRVTTGPQLGTTPAADVAYGQVTTEGGDPAEGAIVYLEMEGVQPQAALVKQSGNWVIPISTARSTDLADFAKYDPQSTRISISVQDATLGTAQAVVTAKNDSPVPGIKLGGTYDFIAASTAVSPTKQPESKFSDKPLPTPARSVDTGGLTVVSPITGEKLNTDKPVIIGKAPAGTEVTIEIHSDTTITGTVTSDKTGAFTFPVPTNLAPGVHTMTISAIVNGVRRTVIKSFTVYALGESTVPAFTATPSATLAIKPTATPTVTIKPTVKPTILPTMTLIPTAKPTLKPTATPTVEVVFPSTNSATPVTGSTDFTILMLALGAGLTVSGLWWYKRVV